MKKKLPLTVILIFIFFYYNNFINRQIKDVPIQERQELFSSYETNSIHGKMDMMMICISMNIKIKSKIYTLTENNIFM